MIRNRSVPTSTVIPVLSYPDVPEATDWLCRAFGFHVRLRIGSHRAQLVHGDGAVILTDTGAMPDAGPGTAHHVHLAVANADDSHARAVAAGARIVDAPADHEYGERQFTAEDPWGHRWRISQSIADVDPALWGGELVVREHVQPALRKRR
jgi:uncharacterized glyoxalase superfamily protein PhnB